MSDSKLTEQSPFSARLLAWFNERFPFANALLFFILYLTCAAVARHDSGMITISLLDVVGCLVAWSYFLVLRIFDEHKDYDLDLHNHPDRVLQSGLITLNHLKTLAVIAIAAQIIWSVYLDQWSLGPATIAWLIAFAWTCLMGKEFFCGEWLEKRLTLYAFSHMLVMPLIVWWLLNIGGNAGAMGMSIWLLMAVAFVSGFCFEITRKAKGQDEERDTIDSYSRIFGFRGAAFIVIALVLTMSATQLALINEITGTLAWWAITIIALFTAAAIWSLKKYMKEPTTDAREKNEAFVALLMLAGYAVIIASALSSSSIQFNFW